MALEARDSDNPHGPALHSDLEAFLLLEMSQGFRFVSPFTINDWEPHVKKDQIEKDECEETNLRLQLKTLFRSLLLSYSIKSNALYNLSLQDRHLAAELKLTC